MYFYRKGKEQHLDLRGNFILSFNDAISKVRSKSAGPYKIHHAEYTLLNDLKFWQRIFITFKVIGFIWGNDESLKPENTNLRTPHVVNGETHSPVIDDLDDSNPPTDDSDIAESPKDYDVCICKNPVDGSPLNQCDECPR